MSSAPTTETADSSIIPDILSDENYAPKPSTSIIYFLVITLLYGILNIYFIYNTQTLGDTEAAKNKGIFNIIYIGLLLIGSYFINATISKSLCNTKLVNWSQIFILTIVPWIVVFGLLYFLLELFEGWVKPFSNTIGYLIVDAIGCGKKITDNINDISDDTNGKGELLKAIQSINKNKSMFINEFSVDRVEFEKFIDKMGTSGLLRDINDDSINKFKNEMYQHVIAKHVIGKIIWYLLAGTLIASITYNNIINMTCDKTMSEVQTQYDKLFKVEKIYKGTRWKKITTDEKDKNNLTQDRNIEDKLIAHFKDRFTTDYVTLSNDDLLTSGIRYITLLQNSYITIDGSSYYKAIT